MVERRSSLARRIEGIVGRHILRVTDPQDGWPALATLNVDGQAMDVALFVGPVGLSHRNRDNVERRFQNPGKNRPIIHVPGRKSLLLGLWHDDDLVTVDRPVLVLADAYLRTGNLTRYSVFESLGALEQAVLTGWSAGPNDAGEIIRCFDPRLLPIAVQDAEVPGGDGDGARFQDAIGGAGLIEEDDDPAAERARRATQVIIRDRRFSGAVRRAYDGKCAMCNLGLDLVQGAHIYPASAPGSSDEVWNGIPLCPNHHVAFDRYLIYVDPITREITFHPSVLADPTAKLLIATTHKKLAGPNTQAAVPKASMFARRYNFYSDKYLWVPKP